MERVIIIRYCELHLKGKNRGFFERLFAVNMERALKGIKHEIRRRSGRYLIEGFDEGDVSLILSKLGKVFGIHTISAGYKVPSDMGDIYSAAKLVCPSAGTFKVETHRADKHFELNSMQISAQIGGRLLDEFKGLSVDVHDPEHIVYIDVREDGTTLVFGKFIKGAGGMPVGSAGKGLLLISGGIDSPVAGHMIAKRGMSIDCVHFHSYPYTNMQAREKVTDLAKTLSGYTCGMTLNVVKVTHIQEEIHKKCNGWRAVHHNRRKFGSGRQSDDRGDDLI